jgi:hypothetical protein
MLGLITFQCMMCCQAGTRFCQAEDGIASIKHVYLGTEHGLDVNSRLRCYLCQCFVSAALV